jgi:uncharacterized membrane protein YeaQ/YmgE (transglycosylase-associated protein family)
MRQATDTVGRPAMAERICGEEMADMVNLLLWLLFGALIGWLASLLVGTDADQGLALNMVVGMIGALIGGFLFGANTITSGGFDLAALVVSLIGATILLGFVDLVRRSNLR